MSVMNLACTIRERNVLARAKLTVGLLMSWKSESGLQLEKREMWRKCGARRAR